jgi:hypothetical protein
LFRLFDSDLPRFVTIASQIDSIDARPKMKVTESLCPFNDDDPVFVFDNLVKADGKSGVTAI